MKTVSATEARIHLGELLDDIERNDAITVEQAGNAETVVIPVSEAQELSGTPTEGPDWRQSLERARTSFARDLGDRPRPDFVEMIREMREERSVEGSVFRPDPGDWQEAFANVRARMRNEVGDQPLDLDEIIHRMREERIAELLDGLH